VEGQIKRFGTPYKDKKYTYIEITNEDGHNVCLLYVRPYGPDGRRLFKAGDKIERGQIIGTLEDIASKPRKSDKKMKNHVHIDVSKDGKRVDPTPWFESWRSK
jgi:hypothetical protein